MSAKMLHLAQARQPAQRSELPATTKSPPSSHNRSGESLRLITCDLWLCDTSNIHQSDVNPTIRHWSLHSEHAAAQ